MKSWMKYTLTFIIISFVGIIFYKKVYIPKRTFKITKATKGDLRVFVEGIGNVGAKNIYNITAQTGGRILKIMTDEGKWVKKGDLLIVMDGVDLHALLSELKATLLKAKYGVISSQKELQNQKAQEIFLQKTFNRYSKLNSKGYVSRAEYDKAKADLQSIKATIQGTISQINAAKEEVKKTRESIKALKIKISRLKVYSPIDGYVISKNAEEQQTVLPTTTILKIVNPKTLWIETNIDESVSSQIKPNQKAKIYLRSNPNKLLYGKVNRIEAVSDPVTLEKKIDVSFDKVPEPFFINEQAKVAIMTKKYKNVFKIPLDLLVQKNGKLGIWILKNDKAHFLKIVKIGENNNEIAIKNINSKTKIIIPNSSKTLKEGMKIYL